jgi:hypothetical protein
VEVTFRGSPSQIAATMREMVSAESSATQAANGTSSPQQVADRILPLVGAVRH